MNHDGSESKHKQSDLGKEIGRGRKSGKSVRELRSVAIVSTLNYINSAGVAHDIA